MNLETVLPFLNKSTTVRTETSLRMARGTLRAAFILSEELGARAAARLFTTPRRHRRPEREQPILDQRSNHLRQYQLVVRREPRRCGAARRQFARDRSRLLDG